MLFLESLNEQALHLIDGPKQEVDRIVAPAATRRPPLPERPASADAPKPRCATPAGSTSLGRSSSARPLSRVGGADTLDCAVAAAGEQEHGYLPSSWQSPVPSRHPGESGELPEPEEAPGPEEVDSFGLAAVYARAEQGVSTPPAVDRLAAGQADSDALGVTDDLWAAAGSSPSIEGEVEHPSAASSSRAVPAARKRRSPSHNAEASALVARGSAPEERVLDIAQGIESDNVMRLLQTPRAKEACKKLGITPGDLRPRRLQDFVQIGDLPERAQMRFNHHENKRQQKLKEVLAERSKIVKDRMEKEVNGAGRADFQSLQMIEDILDQEARRLERQVRSQVRQSEITERDNKQQLEKEQKLRERKQHMNRVCSKAEYLKEQRALQVREDNGSRFQRKAELLEHQEQDLANRNAEFLALQLEEEVRLQEFKFRKASEVQDQGEKWRRKMEIVESKQDELRAEAIVKGEEKLADYQDRLELLDEKRTQENNEKLMRHEEKHLRIVDAHEKRHQLDRLGEQRRSEVAQQLERREQRIDTLCVLKDQILEQRRARNQARVVNKERAVDIRSYAPGPGAYEPQPSTLNDVPGAKISSARPKAGEGSIDAAVARAKSVPAPGSYNPKQLPTGQGPLGACGGPKFREGKKKTFLDEQAREARNLPGPGAYESSKNLQADQGTRFGRDYMEFLNAGGAVSGPGRAASWSRINDSCTPGPAAYNIASCGKPRLLQRSNQSLPVLSKALAD